MKDVDRWIEMEQELDEIDSDSEECAYCGVIVPGDDLDYIAYGTDDEAWSKLAKLHGPNCEWVVTHAHRVKAPVSDEASMWSRANDLAQGDPLRRSYWLDYFRHGGWL